MFSLVEFKSRYHHISSSCVNVTLHTENQLSNLPGSALKVPVGGGGWVVLGGWFENEISDCLWLEPSLGQAEQYLIGKM